MHTQAPRAASLSSSQPEGRASPVERPATSLEVDSRGQQHTVPRPSGGWARGCPGPAFHLDSAWKQTRQASRHSSGLGRLVSEVPFSTLKNLQLTGLPLPATREDATVGQEPGATLALGAPSAAADIWEPSLSLLSPVQFSTAWTHPLSVGPGSSRHLCPSRCCCRSRRCQPGLPSQGHQLELEPQPQPLSLPSVLLKSRWLSSGRDTLLGGTGEHTYILGETHKDTGFIIPSGLQPGPF